MTLAEAIARAAALREEADRADREIGDHVSAELDALPIDWNGPIYDVCGMVAREGFTREGNAPITVHVTGDGAWHFYASPAGNGSGATASEALADALRKHRIA